MVRTIVVAATVLMSVAGVVAGEVWPATFHSGRVVAVDRGRGTLTIEEVGPRGADGVTRATPFKASIGSWTEVGLAVRAGMPTPEEFPGMWTEVPLTLDDVSPGDYVTVESERRGRTDVATRIVITLDE